MIIEPSPGSNPESDHITNQTTTVAAQAECPRKPAKPPPPPYGGLPSGPVLAFAQRLLRRAERKYRNRKSRGIKAVLNQLVNLCQIPFDEAMTLWNGYLDKVGMQATEEERCAIYVEVRTRCGGLGRDRLEKVLKKRLEAEADHTSANGYTTHPTTLASGWVEVVNPTPSADSIFANYYEQQVQTGQQVRVVNAGYPVGAIVAQLHSLTDGWPRRVGENLFVAENGRPRYLRSSSALFAWIGRQLSSRGQNRLRWAKGNDMVERGEFLEAVKDEAPTVEAVETCPHFPEIRGHYYCCGEYTQRTSGKTLEGLLDRFNPSRRVDRDYIRAFFASLVWGGPLGQRPAWLFTADEKAPNGGRGVGKTLIPMLASELVGGYLLFSSRDDIKDMQNRILSPEGRAKRVAIIDNVKSPKFSWSDLEAFITMRYFSGKEMYTGEGQRPNTLNWVVTINGPAMSTDLAQRSIIIKLKQPTYSATWYEETLGYIQRHREDLLNDLATLLGTCIRSEVKVATRWATWESQVLVRSTEDLERCQTELLRRQREVDQDADDAELVREEVIRWLTLQRKYNPDTAVVAFGPDHVAAIYNEAMREHLNRNQAGSKMRLLNIPELKPDPSRKHGRRWIWRGTQAHKRQAPVAFGEPMKRPLDAPTDDI